MHKEDKNKSEKKSTNKNGKSNKKDETNTIHSQNEEIKEGEVEVNDNHKS